MTHSPLTRRVHRWPVLAAVFALLFAGAQAVSGSASYQDRGERYARAQASPDAHRARTRVADNTRFERPQAAWQRESVVHQRPTYQRSVNTSHEYHRGGYDRSTVSQAGYHDRPHHASSSRSRLSVDLSYSQHSGYRSYDHHYYQRRSYSYAPVYYHPAPVYHQPIYHRPVYQRPVYRPASVTYTYTATYHTPVYRPRYVYDCYPVVSVGYGLHAPRYHHRASSGLSVGIRYTYRR